MNPQRALRPALALGAIALGLGSAAIAQTSPDQAATTTQTTVTTPAAPATSSPGTLALPTPPANVNAATPAGTVTTQPPSYTGTVIGSSDVSRLDNPSMAFDKLARGRMFISPADASPLPGFGDAFAKADRDHDGRLDRTEFVDAWSYYLAGNAAPATASTTTTTSVVVAPSQ